MACTVSMGDVCDAGADWPSGRSGEVVCVILLLTRSTRVRICLLANFFSPFSNFKSHQKSIYFLIKMKEIIKVSGRVRVGVGRALLSQ